MQMIRDAVKCNDHDLAVVVIMLGPLTMMYWYLMDCADALASAL